MQTLIADLLTKLASRLITEGIARLHATDAGKEIDKKLETFKRVYEKAFDGTPITKDQKNEINKAISDFIRGTAGKL